MTAAAFLEQRRETIVGEAAASLEQAHERHYAPVGSAELRGRLEQVYDLLQVAAAGRDLGPVLDRATRLARERYRAGYGLAELQTAFNALEEAVWRAASAELEAAELAETLGLVTTIVGAAKDTLAREYVSLAARARAPALDLRALYDA